MASYGFSQLHVAPRDRGDSGQLDLNNTGEEQVLLKYFILQTVQLSGISSTCVARARNQQLPSPRVGGKAWGEAQGGAGQEGGQLLAELPTVVIHLKTDSVCDSTYCNT